MRVEVVPIQVATDGSNTPATFIPHSRTHSSLKRRAERQNWAFNRNFFLPAQYVDHCALSHENIALTSDCHKKAVTAAMSGTSATLPLRCVNRAHAYKTEKCTDIDLEAHCAQTEVA